MATYLDRILDAHRAAAGADGRSVEALRSQAADLPDARGFASALRGAAGLGVIAEVKRASPSKGALNADLDPAEVARAYAAGGATCLSVLTDRDWFSGSPQDLQAARAAVDIPVLRKDFTVCEADVCDARIMGADAVLLIAAALDDAELAAFHALAHDIGLDVLVEIHDEAELERAMAVGASLVGVNQRDLVTFEVDTDRAVRVAPLMPAGVVRVAESGVRGVADATRLAEAGYPRGPGGGVARDRGRPRRSGGCAAGRPPALIAPIWELDGARCRLPGGPLHRPSWVRNPRAMTTRTRTLLVALLLAACAPLALGACGSAESSAQEATPTTELDPTLSVADATIDWPANPSTAAVRMVVRNGTGSSDALVGVSSPIAGAATVHRSEVDDEGRSVMTAQPRLEIPARSSVTFEPNGLHVMLTGITADLAVGDEVPLTVTFEDAGDVTVSATVIEPGSSNHEDAHDD